MMGFSAVRAEVKEVVTKEDLQAIFERLSRLEEQNSRLEAENRAQARRISELEERSRVVAVKKDESAAEALPTGVESKRETSEGTKVNDSGRVFTTEQGFQYYLSDKVAGLFEPLSESGLKITPYGHMAFEVVHCTRGTEGEVYADWVKRPSSSGYNNHTTIFTVMDSILGLQFETPEMSNGWLFKGRAEFDLAGGNANDYAFHWRHLYVDASHAESGWSFLFGQTWHLWKMLAPSEIDCAWLENTGHPYRRSPQIRATKEWNFDDSALELRVGMVKGGLGMGGDRDNDGTQDNSASAWPLFEATALYSRDAAWEDVAGKRWTIGVAGMYGRDKSRRILSYGEDGRAATLGESEEFDSSMGMIAATVPFGSFKLQAQFFGGQNLGGVQAGIDQRVGYDYRGRGRAVRTIGGLLDLNYRLNRNWSFAVGYGFDDPNDSDAKFAAGRTFNDRVFVNATYSILDNFRLAIEYARLATDYYDEGTAYSDRIEFSSYYDF